MSDVTDLLKVSEIFVGLPEDKLKQVLAIGRVRSYDAGETVISEGDPSDELYLVQDGMVEVLVSGGPVPDVPGAHTLTAVVQLGRGQIFGEMALVDRGVRSATIRCVQDDTILFVIPQDGFHKLCDEDHHIGYIVMRNVARDLSFKLRHRNLPRTL
jgi:CRP-like cAMP-binding protein